jgi:hypothetical protein
MSSSSKHQPFRSCLRRPDTLSPLNRGVLKKVTWGALRARNREFVRQLADDPEGDFPEPIYAAPDRVKEHLPKVCRVIGSLHGNRLAASLAMPAAA